MNENSIETQNSKDAKEAASRGQPLEAKSAIGFVEVRGEKRRGEEECRKDEEVEENNDSRERCR